jgi:WD40 repeat protein
MVRKVTGLDSARHDAISFAPDGKTLVLTNAYNYQFDVFDAPTGDKVYHKAHMRWTFDSARFGANPPPLSFSANSKTLVGAFDGRVCMWDAPTGRDVPRLPGHNATVDSLHFSADGRSLTTRSGTSICQWNVSDWKQSSRVDVTAPTPGPAPVVVAIAPDGKSWVCRRKDGDAELRDSVTGRCLRRFDVEGNKVRWDSVFSENGERLFLQSTMDNYNLCDGRFFDPLSGTCVGRFTTERDPRKLTLSPDGSTYLWIDENDGLLNVAEVTTGKTVCRLGEKALNHNDLESRVTFSPDNRFVAYSAGFTNDETPTCPIRIFDLKTGKQIATWGIPGVDLPSELVVGMAFSPDGNLLATVQQGDMSVRVWEVRTGLERRRFEGHKHWPYCIAFAPDGRLLASGSKDTTTLVWDLSSPSAAGPKKTKLSAHELAEAWGRLAELNGARADSAVWSFAESPEQSLPFLQERLHPVPNVEPARVASLIADLDSKDFARRDRASAELESFEEAVAPAIKAALPGQPSKEAMQRLEAVLERLPTEDTIPAGQALRRIRAIEVLERIGTPAACKLLKELSEGSAQARTTIEAKAAYRRATARRHPISETQGAADR